MPNYLRLVAGAFAGTGALIFIWKGEYLIGSNLLFAMLSFFVGEKNGERKASSSD